MEIPSTKGKEVKLENIHPSKFLYYKEGSQERCAREDCYWYEKAWISSMDWNTYGGNWSLQLRMQQGTQEIWTPEKYSWSNDHRALIVGRFQWKIRKYINKKGTKSNKKKRGKVVTMRQNILTHTRNKNTKKIQLKEWWKSLNSGRISVKNKKIHKQEENEEK